MRSFLTLGLMALLCACTPISGIYYDTDVPDDDDSTTPVDIDSDGDGYTNAIDCDDQDASINPGATEVCDDIDNDCDGDVDAGLQSEFWADADGDSFGDATHSIWACVGPSGFTSDSTDCDDQDASINPGATEVCDSADNNCDGQIDEDVLLTFYGDWDNDGYGDAGTLAYACWAPAGFLSDSTDCNDEDFNVHPGASEICDTIDNDCDGNVDDADGSLDLSTRSSFFADTDGDGYGDSAVNTLACSAPSGTVMDSTDCDDGVASIYPGAPEVCDGSDNDCDGSVDENLSETWYADLDSDGYGAGGAIAVICNGSSGSLVDNNTDCDDSEPTANPGATEVCDNIDNDCDGQVDEIDGNPDVQTLWDDDDGDGFGDEAGGSFLACPAPGWVVQGGDCDDAEPLANVGLSEVYLDGIDNDCDGDVDEGGIYCCLDADGDGYGYNGNCSFEVTGVCDPGYVPGDGDCNDANFSYHPFALDILGDGLDTDCDLTDE